MSTSSLAAAAAATVLALRSALLNVRAAPDVAAEFEEEFIIARSDAQNALQELASTVEVKQQFTEPYEGVAHTGAQLARKIAWEIGTGGAGPADLADAATALQALQADYQGIGD